MLERSPLQIVKTVNTANTVNNVTGRRVLFGVLAAVTMIGMLGLMAMALSPGGISLVDVVILVLFAVVLPWIVVGFWNAVIGFLIMRFATDPVVAVLPAAAGIRGDEAITASTAILLCIRNELPGRMVRNLEPMMVGLAGAGVGDRFHIYVLSDTSDAGIAAEETARFGALAARWRGRIPSLTGDASQYGL